VNLVGAPGDRFLGDGLRGSVRVSFEEGTCASWLHDLLKPHVSEVLVCDSRKNALLRVGNKNDREDARKLVRTVVPGAQLKRSKKAVTIRGLNKNHNHDLKNIFKGAATRAGSTCGT
jgi:hypothetical protein